MVLSRDLGHCLIPGFRFVSAPYDDQRNTEVALHAACKGEWPLFHPCSRHGRHEPAVQWHRAVCCTPLPLRGMLSSETQLSPSSPINTSIDLLPVVLTLPILRGPGGSPSPVQGLAPANLPAGHVLPRGTAVTLGGH